ncbi:MAG TPA: SDR family NAD(P)-dependent oxidoreductase [Rhodospirillales bacterium]|jgi:NAD(P)-dependent dehydrogenase (short-subunit alcohol dehydrogenase family)|nr:SDR family NAD(P)-dependent oxidoreductase [Rhodospirillales bacterium]HJO69562.1 SDR family NAD(P)-dependent oxidoreductase [Rhodospirillales bacterium]
MLPPQDRVVLVSGANRGIGYAIARRLHDDGYQLSLGVRNPESVPDDPPFEDQRVQIVAYEAREVAATERWAEAAFRRFGRIDALVNNASVNHWVSIEEGSVEELDEMWEVNVRAPFLLTRAVFPYLKRTRHGRVVNIASLSGKRVKSPLAGYFMSKFALVALNHSTRYAGWEHGIRATAVCPGTVNTEMVREEMPIPRADLVQPDDVARLVALALSMPNNATVSEIPVNCMLESLA